MRQLGSKFHVLRTYCRAARGDESHCKWFAHFCAAINAQCPKMPQNSFRTGEDMPKREPRQVKTGPQQHTTGPDRPKTSQDRPRQAQDSAKTGPRPTKTGPRQPQTDPRQLTGRPRQAKTAPRQAKTGPKKPFGPNCGRSKSRTTTVFPMVSAYTHDFIAKAAQERKKCQHSANMAPTCGGFDSDFGGCSPP